MKPETKIATLKARCERAELARINRLTGLSFSEVPVSLVNGIVADDEEPLAERLLDDALALWREEQLSATV